MGKEFRGRFWARCSLCYSCPILWYWFPPPQVFSHFCQIPQIHLLPEVTTSHYRRPRSSSYVDHRAADSSDWAINLNRGSIRDGAATPHTPAPASTTTHDARSRSVPTQESAFAATTCSINVSLIILQQCIRLIYRAPFAFSYPYSRLIFVVRFHMSTV